MNRRQWALVRASRVADRTLQRIADVGVASVWALDRARVAVSTWLADRADALILWLTDRADVKVTEFANVTDDEAA